MNSNQTLSIAAEHCSGCMRCMLACSFFHSPDESFNLSQSRIQVTPGPNMGQSEVGLSEQCDQCGACLKYCEFEVLIRG